MLLSQEGAGEMRHQTGGESRLMLTGQKGKSKVVRNVEVAKAESQDAMIGKKAVARCPG